MKNTVFKNYIHYYIWMLYIYEYTCCISYKIEIGCLWIAKDRCAHTLTFSHTIYLSIYLYKSYILCICVNGQKARDCSHFWSPCASPIRSKSVIVNLFICASCIHDLNIHHRHELLLPTYRCVYNNNVICIHCYSYSIIHVIYFCYGNVTYPMQAAVCLVLVIAVKKK